MDFAPGFLGWSAISVIALYLVIRFITGRMIVWDPAETDDEARTFRKAILSYKPVWAGYALWLGAAIATFVFAHFDGMLSRLPILYVIAIQMWALHTPRQYRSAASKVLCATLPFSLGFFVTMYPKENLHTFISLLVWISISMLMQVLTLKAVSNAAAREAKERRAFFDNNNVFGTPGTALQNSDLNEQNVKLGIKGEKQTASVLNKLATENSELYIFHSVQWLSNGTYDIDHVAYYKGNVIFLDSKFWGNGVHEIDDYNIVYKDGVKRNLEIHLPTALEEYKEYVYMNQADVWVVVQGNNPAGVIIGQCDNNDDVLLVAGSDLEFNMRSWMKLIDDRGWGQRTDYEALSMFQSKLQ